MPGYGRAAAAAIGDQQRVNGDQSPSGAIDEMLAGLGGWRGERLSRVRELIKRGAPDAVEELKWKKPSNPDGVPVWSDSGMVCTGLVRAAVQLNRDGRRRYAPGSEARGG